jgi:hypothetical protein
MDFLVAATLLPLAQAAQSAPHPAGVAGNVFKTLMPAGGLFIVAAAIAIGVITQILAYWIAAKVVVGDPRGNLANAFKVWLLYFLVSIGWVLGLAIAVAATTAAGKEGAVIAVCGGFSILGLALAFLIPIKIFEVGLPRAVAFLLLSLVLMFASQAAIHRARGEPAFGRLPEAIATLRSPEKRAQLLEKIAGSAKPKGLDADLDRLALAEERAKPFPERQDNLRKVYEALDARQKTLPPNDAKALAEYDRLRAKYEELVRVLKADFAASKAQPPAP